MDPTIRIEDNIIQNDQSDQSSNRSSRWKFFGQNLPRSEIVFFVQVIMVYIVAIVSVVNLTINRYNDKLWIALLSSSIGIRKLGFIAESQFKNKVMSDFFLTLPSNVSQEDKTNKFCVHLPRKIVLQGKWEVALVEI